MLKKENKIYAVVCPDAGIRCQLMARLVVKLGFASIPSDALKIIRQDITDVDLSTAYFVFVANYNFRGAIHTNQRLYEMAARGLAVVVGVKAIPREYQFLTKAFYLEDF